MDFTITNGGTSLLTILMFGFGIAATAIFVFFLFTLGRGVAQEVSDERADHEAAHPQDHGAPPEQ